MSIFVTTHLVLGDEPTSVSGHIVRCETAEEAHLVMLAGGTAVLPEGDFAAAEQTLRLNGASDEQIRLQMAWAKGEDRVTASL
jgi:hypothetical protein